MKSLKYFFVILFLSCIAASSVDAQALVVKDQDWYWHGYTSYDAHEVISPDGTVNLRVNWEFDLNHPLVLEAIALGEPLEMEIDAWDVGRGLVIPSVVKIFPNGRVKLKGKIEPAP